MQIKSLIKQCGKFLLRKSVIYNVFATKYNKNCLLIYITSPFRNDLDAGRHQNIWQAREIASIFSRMHYNVDCADYRDDIVWLRNKYDVVFDICAKEHPIYKGHLKKNAKRIIYFTGSESKFANLAELKRIEDVYNRRQIRLQPRRQAPLICRSVEEYDGAIMIGNEYNLETYKDFRLPQTYMVPNTGYDFVFSFDKIKKKTTSFLYFGSSGCVHKGLDLLLEVFSEEEFPCKLFVCGCVETEEDFKQAYHHELYECDNIVTCGFVDIFSEKFKEITDECVYTILPSCSEGMAGTVATCLSASMIPICSRECGYEENEVLTLYSCSVKEIKEKVLWASRKSIEWAMDRSRFSYNLSRTKYHCSSFSHEMKKAIMEIIRNNGKSETV